MVDKNVLRKDFEVFSKGIQRLEELRADLDSLNTSKFKKEELSIRSKLKNVSEIPQIERELKILKQKISGTHKPTKVVKKVNPLESKIKELENQVERKKDSEKRDAKISKEVSELEKELFKCRVVESLTL